MNPFHKQGSFLFATKKNHLNIISISRFGSAAIFLKEGEYVTSGVTYIIRMDDNEYEEYIDSISKQILDGHLV